jgi:ABC-type bacteriocin/lantibiotic exporter with double-glycine peptidase domain
VAALNALCAIARIHHIAADPTTVAHASGVGDLIRKYRRLLAEVLVVSLYLQLFALFSPLFFQAELAMATLNATNASLAEQLKAAQSGALRSKILLQNLSKQ